MKKATKQLPNKIFFPNLDGLRFIAFLMVFVGHSINISIFGTEYSLFEKIILLCFSGGTGVSIFFVLSGFLITYLLVHEREYKGKIKIWHFYMRRFLRIWPLYFAVLCFAFIVYPFFKSKYGITAPSGNPLLYYSFLSNFDVIRQLNNSPETILLMQANTWSIAVEEQFYLIWPLIFLIIPKRLYGITFLLIIVICYVFRFINRTDYYVLYYHSLSVCADMAFGGLCAYLSYYSKKFTDMIKGLPRPTIIFVYLIGILWLAIANQLFYKTASLSLTRLVNIIFFGFIILEQNYCKASFYKFSKFSFLSYWGKYTYGLYLLHPIVLYLFEIVAFKALMLNPRDSYIINLPFAIISFVGSLSLSYFSYNYFELWFLDLKDRFFAINKPALQKEIGLEMLKQPIAFKS